MRSNTTVAEGRAAPDRRTNGDGEAESISLKKKFFNIRTLVSFAVAFALLFFVFRQMNLDLGVIVGHMASANPVFFLLATLIYYSTFLFRSRRWQLLLRNVGLDEDAGKRLPSLLGTAEIIFLSWFANCIMPAKLGDAYRAYLLKHNADVSFSKTLGTILAERIIDLLLTFTMLGATGLIAFHGSLPPTVVMGMQASLILVVAVIAGLLAMRHLGPLIRRVLPRRFHRYYGPFEEGTLGSFRQLPMVLTLSFLAWTFEAGRLYFVVLSLGLFGVPFPVVLFTAIAASLLTSLPGTPAGLGFVESVMIGVLLLAASLGLVSGMNEGMATSVAILDRVISYWSLVAFGFIAYLLSKKK